MNMRHLELDYVRPSRRRAWASGVLVTVALAFAGSLALDYQTLSADIARKQAQLVRTGGFAPGDARTAVRNVSEEEINVARDTIRRLSLPWGDLFDALGGATVEGVALISIEPDAEAGTVLLSGEARDYLAVLSYVSVLSQAKTLRNVHVLRHEIRPGAPQSVQFSVAATWRQRRP